MLRGAVVRSLGEAGELSSGAHVVVLTERPWDGLGARRLGWEFRDTLLVLRPNGPLMALLFRVPCSEATVAENILRHGTGALNIAATRVQHASASDFERHKAGVEAIKARGGTMADSWKNSSDLSGASEVTTAGRWPSNLVLIHGPECQALGTRTVKAPAINRFTDGMKPFGVGAGHPYESTGGGTEEQVVYDCVLGCPVAELDRMSGVGSSTRRQPTGGPILNPDTGWNPNTMTDTTERGFSDSGGASRFFPQFDSEAALLEWFRTLLGTDGVHVSV
jgi:hypothetical protein